MNFVIGGRTRVVHGHDGPIHRQRMFFPGDWRDNDAIVYRDAIGRKGHETYAWLPLICAMSWECNAQVLVRRDLIDEIADMAMEMRM